MKGLPVADTDPSDDTFSHAPAAKSNFRVPSDSSDMSNVMGSPVASIEEVAG
jgi:hypothetical protein